MNERGVPRHNVVVLTDMQATEFTVSRALRDAVDRTTSQGALFFVFIGHSIYLPDRVAPAMTTARLTRAVGHSGDTSSRPMPPLRVARTVRA